MVGSANTDRHAIQEDGLDLRALLDHAPEIIARYDQELRHVYINEAVERFTGHPPSYYLGRNDRELGTPTASGATVQQALEKVLESGQEHSVEIRLQGPAGESWHQACLVPETNTDGEIQSVLAMFQDITKLRCAEAALRESESRFRTLVETASEAIVVVDAGSVKFVDANTHACELYGIEREELLQLGPLDISPLRQPDGRLSQVAADAYMQAALEGEIQVFEWIHTHANGRRFPCEVRLVRFPSREADLVRATIYDIQPRKEAERLREHQAAQYHELFDRIPVGLYRTKPDGTILAVNEALVRLLGYPDKDTLLKRTAVEVQAHSLNREHWQRTLEEDDVYYGYETQLVRFDGSSVWVRENTRVNRHPDGSVRCYEGSMEDITEAKHTHELLLRSEQRYRSLFDGVPVGLYRTAPDGEILQANQTLVSMLGFPDLESMKAASTTDLYPDPADREDAIRTLCEVGSFADYEFQIKRRDGTLIWVRENAHAALDPLGEILYFEGSMEDISIQKAAQEEVARLAAFPTENPNPVLASDLRGEVTYANPSARLLLEQLGLKRIEKLLPQDHEELVARACNSNRTVHSQDVEAGGRCFRWSYYPQLPFRTVHLYALDITDQKQAEDQLRFEAFHDSLTGLANRALFMDHLHQSILKLRRRSDCHFGVLFLDLDRFKLINDSLGHLIGDRLLIQVGERLRSRVRELDTVARFGGDEFAVLLEDVETEEDAALVCRRIQEALNGPFNIGEHVVFTSVSIGIALSNPSYQRGEDMLRDADIAMYQAKSDGLPYEFFRVSMHQKAMEQLALETELRQAIDQHQFLLHYQPIYEFPGRRLVGLEALLRWQHPDRGLLLPAEFLHVAEEAGLMPAVLDWTLSEVGRQVTKWRQRVPGVGDFTVGVNISASQARDHGLVERVQGALATGGLDPESLVLELPEGVLLREADLVEPALTNLKEMGIGVYVDDFGIGYSSLSFLHHFPIDALKIDHAIIQGLTTDGKGEAMVCAILELARSLAIDVIAEGVETEGQHACLARLNCRRAQGFLYSSPLNAASALSLLKDERINRSSP